jgi:hypothetical protein
MAGRDDDWRVTARLWSVTAAMTAIAACSAQPKRDMWAMVIDIRPHFSPKWNIDEWVVEARTVDGLRGTKSILRANLDCRVGDAVRVTVQGVSVTLDSDACERFGAPPP